MLYLSRNILANAKVIALLPLPIAKVISFRYTQCDRGRAIPTYRPTNAYSERPLFPIPSRVIRQISFSEFAWVLHYLVSVAVVCLSRV